MARGHSRRAAETLALGPYLAAIPVVILIFIFSQAVNQQYHSWRGRTLVDQLFAMTSGVALAAMLILAGMSLYRGFQYARLTLVYTVLISWLLLTIERYILRQWETRLRRRRIGAERVLMVGTGTGSQWIQRMTMFPQYGYQVFGVVDSVRARQLIRPGASRPTHGRPAAHQGTPDRPGLP